MGKCNDLRLFLYSHKIWHDSFAEQGKTPEVSLKEKYIAVFAVYSMRNSKEFANAKLSMPNPLGMECNGVRDD